VPRDEPGSVRDPAGCETGREGTVVTRPSRKCIQSCSDLTMAIPPSGSYARSGLVRDTGRNGKLTRGFVVAPAAIRHVPDAGGGRAAVHDEAWGPRARRLLSTSPPGSRRTSWLMPLHYRSVPTRSTWVSLAEVLEYLGDPRAAVEEAITVLRPGGALVGSVPFMYPIHGDPHDYFRHAREGVRVLLSGCAEVRRAASRSPQRALDDPHAELEAPSGTQSLGRLQGTRVNSHCPEGCTLLALRAPR